MKTLTHRKIGNRLRARIIQRFKNAGVADGDSPIDRWEPLSEVTIQHRRAIGKWPGKGGRQPIKRMTLGLQKSIRVFQGKGKGIVRVGSSKSYAPIQEFGGPLVNIDVEPGMTRADVEKEAKGSYVYLTLMSQNGKKKRIRVSSNAKVPPRPAIYFNELMIEECVVIIKEFVATRFAKDPPTVDKIIRSAAGLKGIPF